MRITAYCTYGGSDRVLEQLRQDVVQGHLYVGEHGWGVARYLKSKYWRQSGSQNQWRDAVYANTYRRSRWLRKHGVGVVVDYSETVSV